MFGHTHGYMNILIGLGIVSVEGHSAVVHRGKARQPRQMIHVDIHV